VIGGLIVKKFPGKARPDTPGALHYILGRGIEPKKIFDDDDDSDKVSAYFGILSIEAKKVRQCPIAAG
jgi:hypothetical protein